MMKKVLSVLTVFLFAVVMSSAALAFAQIESVKIDGDILTPSGTNQVLDVTRGDEIAVKVRFLATADNDDVQVEASLRGFDSTNSIDDITSAFNTKANVTYIETLRLPLREKLDQDNYLLRVRITDRNSPSIEQVYDLDIDAETHNVEIRDVVLSPNNEVKAGRALLTTVRLRNRGDKDEDGVKVTVSIPELGVSAADFIDELERDGDDDDEATTEEIFLRIPDNAATGDYTLRIEALFDQFEQKNTEEMTIRVIGSELSQPTAPADTAMEKTIITVAIDNQAATAEGGEVAYPLTLTNAGSAAKTYVVTADGADWANFRVSPSNVVVVGAGESKAVTVFAAAGADAPVGQSTFSVTVAAGDQILKQLPMSIVVSQGADEDASLTRGLEVLLVVLIILLVIIGLVIGFSKLRGDDDDDEEKDYY